MSTAALAQSTSERRLPSRNALVPQLNAVGQVSYREHRGKVGKPSNGATDVHFLEREFAERNNQTIEPE